MTIHREGHRSVFFVLVFSVIVSAAAFIWIDCLLIDIAITAVLTFFTCFVMYFFRNPGPRKPFAVNSLQVVSPCDGKVVAIEKITEKEYFGSERVQVSVFMSPLNVHINWFPVDGKVMYAKYYKGDHLVAWHPKSSELNERTSVVVRNPGGAEVLFRQVAGKVARRVVMYSKKDTEVKAAQECGFIKFGSRVDIILPTNASINVKIGDKVQGVYSVIATLV